MTSMKEYWNRRRFLECSGKVGALVAAHPLLAQAPRRTILELARAAERIEGVDIIDVHAHIGETPDNAIWPQRPQDLIADYDRCGITAAVFSHVGALFALTPETLASALEYSASTVRQYPSRLRSYMVFHPHQLQTSLAQFRKVLEPSSPFVGFKLHGPFHQYPASGSLYRQVFQFAHENRLPVLYHVAGMDNDWATVGRLADEFTQARIILAHYGPGEEMLPSLMKGRANLHIDTCLSTGRFRQVERVVRAIGVEKVLFATDAAFNSAVAGFAKVAMTDLPEDEKKMLLSGNARRIFGKSLPPI